MRGKRNRRSDRHQAVQHDSGLMPYPGHSQDLLQIEGFVQAPNIQDALDFMALPDDTLMEDDLYSLGPTAPIETENFEKIQTETVPVKHSHGGLYSLLLIGCSLALFFIAGFVFWLYQPKAAFESRKAFLSQDIIFDGIKIDGLDVGGLTRSEALRKLQQSHNEQQNDLQLSVEVDGATFMITNQQLPYGRNTMDIIDAAFAVGRQGYPWMIGSDKTPFEIRYEHTRHIGETGAQFETKTAVSQEAVTNLLNLLAQKVNRNPQNAQLASFDFETRSFSVSRDMTGIRLDFIASAEAVLNILNTGQRQAHISLPTEVLLPQITAVELQNSLSLLSSFSTRTSADELRNTNIALAARAIHGMALMPGESFSFNQAVGQRTVQRGYQLAPAIAGGVLFDDIGGGICQVSSTLFNAAALANMSIITREPHAWPVSYVEKGLDATVNWPNIDFSFSNDTKSPVFIVTSFKNRDLSIEFYGMRKEEGESLRLETATISTKQPPGSPKYQQNPNLLPGEQRELKKARSGFVVDTYRIYLRDGQEFKRDKLFSSVYPMVQQVIEYN
ncbi:MAG: hypothetical protein GX781_08115 [Clostridiales bacterium]|nr:hypothetical protein [Clostridiales bacterium]